MFKNIVLVFAKPQSSVDEEKVILRLVFPNLKTVVFNMKRKSFNRKSKDEWNGGETVTSISYLEKKCCIVFCPTTKLFYSFQFCLQMTTLKRIITFAEIAMEIKIANPMISGITETVRGQRSTTPLRKKCCILTSWTYTGDDSATKVGDDNAQYYH
ncbi:uncharacterized protein [Musca autumnalis]|uniref:uncharacterized protein n=1 Tax=Musca autumnalis TaxID=221902 RepID=UPI003CECADAC